MRNTRNGAIPASGPPRLLVLGSTFPAEVGDGTPAFVADLTKVEATAFDTVVVVPRVPGSRARERRDGFEVRRYRFFPRRWEDVADGAILENLRARPSRWLQVPALFLAGTLAVRRAVRDVAPDVLHVHWIIPQGLLALLAARRAPWLVTTHGGDLYALTAAPARWLKRRVLRRASLITVMNEEMRGVVLGFGVPPGRVLVRPMGVALERVGASAAAPERVPGRLVFVGRLVEKKGLAHLLEALAGIAGDVDWSLDVIGDGPLRAELVERARRFGSRVTFHGQLTAPQVAGSLAQAEVAVFPSIRARSGDQDGLPVAALEALAAGTPVVASDLPGLRDAVVGGAQPAGVTVPPGSAEALARAVERLLRDGGARERMGRAAVERAREHSMESVGAGYVTLLRAAMSAVPIDRPGGLR